MTESQLKTYLLDFKSIQITASLWNSHPALRSSVENQKIYENLLLQVAVLENALIILDPVERFIIETHLIEHKTWDETAGIFEEKCGIQNGRSERTYKRLQAKALKKIFTFIVGTGADKHFHH